MLYLDCQHDPVRLTEHLQGKKDSCSLRAYFVNLISLWDASAWQFSHCTTMHHGTL